jgi:hypothetical protein
MVLCGVHIRVSSMLPILDFVFRIHTENVYNILPSESDEVHCFRLMQNFDITMRFSTTLAALILSSAALAIALPPMADDLRCNLKSPGTVSQSVAYCSADWS